MSNTELIAIGRNVNYIRSLNMNSIQVKEYTVYETGSEVFITITEMLIINYVIKVINVSK